MIKANDIMSEHIMVIYEDMLVRQVSHLMLRDRVSGFPVVSKEIGLVGIITMTDLFKMIQQSSSRDKDFEHFYQVIEAFKDKRVGEVMSKDVVSISPETSLDQILGHVLDRNIHTFPVLEEGKLVGIVSRHDILNAVFSLD